MRSVTCSLGGSPGPPSSPCGRRRAARQPSALEKGTRRQAGKEDEAHLCRQVDALHLVGQPFLPTAEARLCAGRLARAQPLSPAAGAVDGRDADELADALLDAVAKLVRNLLAELELVAQALAEVVERPARAQPGRDAVRRSPSSSLGRRLLDLTAGGRRGRARADRRRPRRVERRPGRARGRGGRRRVGRLVRGRKAPVDERAARVGRAAVAERAPERRGQARRHALPGGGGGAARSEGGRGSISAD